MNNEWQEFLSRNGASSNSADCALMDLSHLGWIRVTGEDARSLLQGQLSNDINQVTATQSQLSTLCNPKGRMYSNLHIFQHQDALYLQLQREVVDTVLKRLKMFVLRAKVQIEDASDELVSLGIIGHCAEALLDELDSTEVTVVHHRGDTPRIQIIGDVASLKSCWLQLSGKATLVDSNFWPLSDIRAGIAAIYPATVESFIPQMLNLQLLDGISFSKGCFTGQEVVARMHYLGKIKRRMYLARIMADQAPRPGDKLFSPSSKSGQGGGNVVDARPSPEGGFEALVVTQTSSAAAGDLRLQDADGPQVIVSEPSYGFGDEAAENG